MRRNVEKFYRFALYGRSGSGKTCFLSTMAMGAVGHSRGLTCERMPVTVSKPQEGADVGKSPEDDERIGLHAGKAWIDSALRALESGNRPDPNPPTFDGVPATVDYQIGTPLRGDFLVRTVDYSGELIHPGEEHQEQSHVNALKSCLANCDGFLILAEAPRSPDDHKVLSDELRLLRESFASLQEPNDSTHTPVAVVITKWDRWSEVEYSGPEGEIDKLRDYLAENLSHNSLVETIRNAQVHQEDGIDTSALGLFDGNTGVFPATAFGQSVQRDGFDSPVVGQQRPFGLLEPFVWLAERRDYLDANQINHGWSGHRRTCWLPWKWPETVGIAATAKRLLRKMPMKSPDTSVVRSVRRAASFSLTVSVIAWLFLVALGVEIVYEGVRTYQFTEAVAMSENPSSEETVLLEKRGWFDDYSRAWNGFLFRPGADEALARVSKIDRLIDDRYWKKVEEGTELTARAQAAKEYLDSCPNGLHAAECAKIVNEHEASLARQKNADWLSNRQNQFDSAEDEQSLQQLHEELQQHLPEPDFATDEQRQAFRKLRADTATKLAKIRSEKGWQQFVAAYGDAIQADDSVVSSRLLAARQPRDGQWEELVKKFPNDVQAIVGRCLTARLSNHQYDHASRVVDDSRRSLKELETTLRSHDSLLADLLLKGQRELQPESDRVESQHDRYLYEHVRTRKDKESCRSYLDHAPLQAMRSKVEAYINHLENIAKPMTAKVKVEIKWDKNYDYGQHNVVRVYLDGVRVLKTSKYIPATPGELSGVVDDFQVKNKRLGDSVKIRVTIVEDDTFSDDDAGQGVATVRIRELIGGRFIPLPPQDGSPVKNQARLTIAKEDVPKEPELPPWKEQ